MYTRQTILMAAGLALVAMNAIVAGHWLTVKTALVNAPGSPAPTLSLPTPAGVASAAANALKKRVADQAKKQIVDPVGKVVAPPVTVTPGGLVQPKGRPGWWKYIP